MPNLLGLTLQGNNISDLEPFLTIQSSSPLLDSLDLSENPWSDLTPLVPLNLSYLFLGDNPADCQAAGLSEIVAGGTNVVSGCP